MRHSLRLSTLAIAGVLTLAACGGGNDNATVTPSAQASTTVTTAAATSPTTTVASTPTTAAAGVTTTAPPPTTPAVAKVPANTATSAELVAAFTAAGISNPANWAREVIEYRPYPTNDPNLANLRQNLAKYNPGPGVVDAIVATLSV